MFSHSYQWFQSAHMLEGDSLAGSMFNHSHQWFQSAHMLESNSLAGCIFQVSHWFQSAQTLESNSLAGALSVVPICSDMESDSPTGDLSVLISDSNQLEP